jgi:hypothetical protein
MPMDQTITSDNTEVLSKSACTDFLEGFISEPEYARRRGVTLRTCQRDRQLRKAPPYIQFGRRIFYRVDAVRAWLVKNERLEDRSPTPARIRRFQSTSWSKQKASKP